MPIPSPELRRETVAAAAAAVAAARWRKEGTEEERKDPYGESPSSIVRRVDARTKAGQRTDPLPVSLSLASSASPPDPSESSEEKDVLSHAVNVDHADLRGVVMSAGDGIRVREGPVWKGAVCSVPGSGRSGAGFTSAERGPALAALLAAPHASVHLPAAPPSYSPEQTRLVAALVAYFSPAPSDASPLLPLSQDEQLFLSRETLIRFLTATKNDLAATKARLDKCLAWRRSLAVDDIRGTADEVAPEGVCGKDNLVLIIDFAGKKSAPTSPGMAKQFISVLQDFYPERLGTAVLLSIPWIVRKFLDFAFTFVDPITKAKVRWHVDVVKEEIVPADEALREYGGDVDFVYNQEDYWNLLRDTALAKREQYLANWARMGGGVGQPEWEFKQPVPSSSPVLPVTAPASTTTETTIVSPLPITTAAPTLTGTSPATPARTESISSESTFHENHGLDLHAVDKGMGGGMVIAEHAAPTTPPGQVVGA
ncbi:hypothetical protein QFC19_003881 [Naganishia cerealis]|uniref:Uncharacterized protein n=1 Tax=Naganishia cerealis TaxID=610337 RepID=A0ACC2VZ23_9TREE|nr:hypothetical protein QFC19_003881 [Naganishia cerealis]